MKIDPDAPAYGEMHVNSTTGDVRLTEGMTIRAKIAAMAMQGMLVTSYHDDEAPVGECARDAIRFADALIAELNKDTTP